MLSEEYKNLTTDEITNLLIKEDLELIERHNNGLYGNNWADSNQNINIDIVRLCIMGICMYNKLSNININSREFIEYVIDNIEMFLEHGRIPNIMQKYYIDVLNRGNVDYLNNFLLKHGNEEKEGMSNSRGAYTKSTAVGRALVDKESAFVSVLILPAMLVLVYISVVVIYFLFFYNGG